MMTSRELIDRCVDIAEHYKTLYVMGCFGAPMTPANKKRYTQNHEYNRGASRTKMINAATADTFGFDCVNLIKGVLWGWNGYLSAQYGGAKYGSNGVPDVSADGMIQKCKGVTADFRDIVPGAAVWMPGHIGLYIGDGLAVECTPKWANGTQITAVGNIGKKPGYNTRTWKKWGILPYVSYKEEDDMDKATFTAWWNEAMENYRKELGAEKAAPWAVPYIDECIDNGIMSEKGGSIDRPADFLTRQEGAVMMANTLKAAKK